MAGCAPERILLQPLMEGISNCCWEGGGVRVSSQSGSVHSTLSVQSALYCKSLLINLMPLASCIVISRLLPKKKTHIKLCSSVHWIKTFRLFIIAILNILLYYSLQHSGYRSGVAVGVLQKLFNAVRHPCGKFWPLD